MNNYFIIAMVAAVWMATFGFFAKTLRANHFTVNVFDAFS